MSVSKDAEEEFFSAKSHFSTDDKNLDGRSIGITGSGTPSTRKLGAIEPSRILSEEENQAMNDKIDQLIAVIQDGRQLHFSPDPQTGNVNVSAAYRNEGSDGSKSDLEARIAASAENFGKIMGVGDHKYRIRSLNSILFDSPSWSTVSSSSSSSGLKRAIAAADTRYPSGCESNVKHPPPVRKTEPPRLGGRGKGKGHRHAYMENDVIKTHSISPIVLDFYKQPRKSTPSIQSNGSDLDCSSPLFEKSLKAMLKEADKEANELYEPSAIKDPISSWLEGVDAGPVQERNTNFKGKEKHLNVFRDGEKEDLSSGRKSKEGRLTKALKDVSNLRLPGYLRHNSFAHANKPIADSTHRKVLDPIVEPFGGAASADSRRSVIETKWPTLTTNNKLRSIPDSNKLNQNSHDSRQSPDPNSQRPRTPRCKMSVPKKPIDQDEKRAAEFEYTLARLEGRVPPRPYSPIRRYADSRGLYGPDVEVERPQLHRHQPIPRRNCVTGPSAAKKLEASLREHPGRS